MKERREYEELETKAVHTGEPEPRIEGAVVMPIFQSSTYLYGGETDYHDIRYVRLSNSPNHEVLHAKLAALENGEDALVTASGMAAISAAMLSLLSTGEHMLALDCLYGGTHNFVTKDLPDLGIGHTFVDGHDHSGWEAALRPETRLIYVETLTNPLIQMPDLPGVVEFARHHGLTAVVDNTFASPVNFRPPEMGFDLSIHSATKYLNGHTDLAAGALIGRADLVASVKRRLDHLGGLLDPHACYLGRIPREPSRRDDGALHGSREPPTAPAGEPASGRARGHAELRARGWSGGSRVADVAPHDSAGRSQSGGCGDADRASRRRRPRGSDP
jgi:cystathionine beta-lyase/cystathionine gamma-synthase